ncbi:MAG: hypothetical protein O9248_00475 [Rhodobacteraceae bacterium]|nr:hypothetical protein [Paracoccaceae bacterium]
MTAPTNTPFTWLEIENQIRTAILCQLDVLLNFGPDSAELARLFLGVDPDGLDFDLRRGFEHEGEIERTIPLERHGIYGVVRAAYHYAYQTDEWHSATSETYHLGSALLGGAYITADTEGEPSPLAKLNDFPLRRVLETFVARWKLSNEEYRYGLTVRELALLSNMTVPAVRTSLSKEGFKLEANYRAESKDENGVLNEEEALVWLSRRRGFVPTRTDRPTEKELQYSQSMIAGWLDALPFPDALQRILAVTQKDTGSLAVAFSTDPAWLEGLIAGRPVAIGVDQLRKLAQLLGADEAAFVGKAVQHLIRIEQKAG